MKCPKCSKELVEFPTSELVTLDFCGGCKGIWFDKLELAEYVETLEDLPNEKDIALHGSITKFPCPKCGTRLIELPYAGTTTLVDCCPDCGGIWLDFGELKSVEEIAAHIDTKGKLLRAARQIHDKGFVIIGTKVSEE